MIPKIVKISKKPADMDKIAKTFLGALLKSAKKEVALVVGLRGDLGAGKTTFVQAAARHLAVKTKINSPTFVIIKKHKISSKLKNKKHKFLFHLDAYRLKNEKELMVLGWEEIIKNTDHIIFIEWPENVEKAMPKAAKFISILHGKKEDERVLYLH